MTQPPILTKIREECGTPEDALFIHGISGREARYAEIPARLHPRLRSWLIDEGIRPYIHQAEAYQRASAGEDILLATRTASGKTLAFALPIIDRLLSDPDSRALLLYPTKALARDQLAAFQAIDRAIGAGLSPAVYDGDTPRDARPGIRSGSRIIISNMHEIHHILSWRRQWADFFSGTAFVVIDEAHRYRGVFGSHIALLMRRLTRVLAYYDASPVFILASATLGNPEEFAKRLCGRRVRIIAEDGSPQSRKNIVFYNPYLQNPGASLTSEVSRLLAIHMRHHHQTICFSPSRRLAEVIARRTREELAGDPALADRLRAYRAGYLADERREIEAGLKAGHLRGVVSTNALELGVDIGTLDAVLMAGYPGATISFWQQAGRAGRSGDESLVTMVARYDPIDQYYMHHPDRFFAATAEHAAVDMRNPIILSGHLLCAAAEIPLGDGDITYFGDEMMEHLRELADEGLLAWTRKGYVYAGARRPAEAVTLTGSASGGYRIMEKGRLVETMDAAQAYREAYPGAVLLHQDTSYIVRSVDGEAGVIRVDLFEADYFTRPLTTTSVSVDRILESRSQSGLVISFAEVTVTEAITGYQMVRYDRIIGSETLDLPANSFPTQALLLAIDPSLLEDHGIADPDGTLHAAEHALIAAMPGLVICDRNDIGGISTRYHPAADGPAIIIYDGYTGGAGLAAKAYHLTREIADLAATIVGECRCYDGCPACIFSPKCGSDNKPLDKGGSAVLLRSFDTGGDV
ncbi:DEAD/DEAH box helicase domain-containing protein [Methanocalculus alkaliphilus]|uniref:DEAD/DEAH box helicase n=1 Tax=Methanocalculus alkaliphilus TaxID=768730 RepID=UPI00209EB9AF|nr:DEAD/DEAH box helicase domain-containing protein [Methanocalculus alkaliphilus]